MSKQEGVGAILKLYYEEPDIKIYCGHTLETLRTLGDESVNTIITSPPYWGLRDYGEDTKTIWDGDPSCEHKWETERTARPNQGGGKGHLQDANKGSFAVDNQDRSTYSDFCSKCGAWCGQLGLEPTLDLYISHLLQVTAELKRVLRKDGIVFWNQGDAYSTGVSGSMGKNGWDRPSRREVVKAKTGKICPVCGKSFKGGVFRIFCSTKCLNTVSNEERTRYRPLPQKCMILQNFRLILKMVDEQGWILRNNIIWNKPNHMPSSVKDRFANGYEPVFMLVKQSNPQYYYNIKTGLMADRKPKVLKEGIDWDWEEVPDFSKEKEIEGKGSKTQRNVSPRESESGGHYSYGGINSPFSTTKGKVGKLPTKKKKVSYWHALDYWFDLDAVRLPHTDIGKMER